MQFIRQKLIRTSLAFALVLSSSLPVLANEINVYSGRQEALIKPLLDKFSEKSGVTVNLITGKGDALLSRVKAEGELTPADILILADVGRLVRAKQLGITQSIENKELLALVNADYQDAQGHWLALTKRARPIMFKKGEFDPSSLNSLLDLSDPKYKNSICIRSSSNIYNQSMVSALIELWGEEKTLNWSKALVANFARSPKGGDRDQIKAMVAGECKLAIANTYYLGGMLGSKDADTRKIAEQVGVLWHDQSADTNMGVHVNVSGAALIKTAKNKDNALALLSFMLEQESQQWYAQVNHEYPIISGVAHSSELQSLGDFKAQKVALDIVGENNAKALMLMDRAGWK